MRQWAVDQVSEGGFDDGVAAVGDVGLGAAAASWSKRVIAPHRKQRLRVAGVFDPAHYQPHGQRAAGAQPQGVGGFGDLGVGDPRPVSGSSTAPG